jgi:hypothetical protein
MPEDGQDTTPEGPESPKTEINWNAFAWVAVGFVAMVLGFFALIVLMGKMYPW